MCDSNAIYFEQRAEIGNKEANDRKEFGTKRYDTTRKKTEPKRQVYICIYHKQPTSRYVVVIEKKKKKDPGGNIRIDDHRGYNQYGR